MFGMNYFGTGSPGVSGCQTCRDFFENYAALSSADWREEPRVVRKAERPMNRVRPKTGPTDAALRNVFNHLAVHWPGRIFTKHFTVQWQVKTTPREPGIFLQDRRTVLDLDLAGIWIPLRPPPGFDEAIPYRGDGRIDLNLVMAKHL